MSKQERARAASWRTASSPKLQVLNHGAHVGAVRARAGRGARGPDVLGPPRGSAVGAHLANAAAAGECELFYWRDRNVEVDFVARFGKHLLAIEVKSGRPREMPAGLDAFAKAFPGCRKLLVGGDGIPVEDFLPRPPGAWAKS